MGTQLGQMRPNNTRGSKTRQNAQMTGTLTIKQETAWNADTLTWTRRQETRLT